jgi:glycosyltransferase involved in cell wall biosynthesis
MRDFGFALKKGKLLGKLYSVISGFCLKRAQRVIVVDKKSRDVFVKKYPWLINKISVIPIGIDLDIFKPMNKELLREKYGFSNSDKVVIFIGRLEMEKNVDFLIRVCTNLSNKINDLKLLIIGNGSKFNNLKKLVFDLNNDSVVFFGEIENTLISEIINIADVLALCSTYEGSPTVVKEALACNVRIVSNDVGDVKEVLKDFEGSFISKMELDEFEKALGSVLNSKTSHDYQDNIQKYSHINVSLETEAVYEKLY